MTTHTKPPWRTTLFQNTLYMFSGHGIRAAVQAVYFVLIARALGPEQYGAFVAAASLIAILAPFANLGSGNLLIKHVSSNPERFSTYWGSALALTSLCGLTLTVLSAAAASFFLPPDLPWAMILAVAVSDLVLARFVELASHAYVAVERLGRTAQIHVGLTLYRLGAAIAFSIFPLYGSAETWSFLYLGASALSATTSLIMVKRELGWGTLNLRPLLGELREGSYFAISIAAQNIYNDIDKTMLARLADLNAAGIYSAAYRIITTVAAPITSLVYAAYARFFQHGKGGVRSGARFAARLVPTASCYGALAGVAIWLTAPLLPLIVGEEFDASVDSLRWLAALPFLKSLHYFAADTLTGSGYQGTRTAVQLFACAFNVGANLVLLPRHGWLGAAWVSLATDTILACSLWTAIGFRSRREARN